MSTYLKNVTLNILLICLIIAYTTSIKFAVKYSKIYRANCAISLQCL